MTQRCLRHRRQGHNCDMLREVRAGAQLTIARSTGAAHNVRACSTNSPPSSMCHHVSAPRWLTRVAMSHGTPHASPGPPSSPGAGQRRRSGRRGSAGAPAPARWKSCRLTVHGERRSSLKACTSVTRSAPATRPPGAPQPDTIARRGFGKRSHSGRCRHAWKVRMVGASAATSGRATQCTSGARDLCHAQEATAM